MGERTRETTPTRQTPCLEMELEHKACLAALAVAELVVTNTAAPVKTKILRIEILSIRQPPPRPSAAYLLLHLARSLRRHWSDGQQRQS